MSSYSQRKAERNALAEAFVKVCRENGDSEEKIVERLLHNSPLTAGF